MTMRRSITDARVSGSITEQDGRVVFEFRFGAGDPTFAGHFPNRPLLPGVFQLEMVRAAAEWALDCTFAVREISKAKFMRPILPEELVRLKLKLAEQDGSVRAHGAFTVAGEPAGEALLFLCRNL
jgi:3-hydroxyacyl-[acyl-carrier-protein] dehydratase